MWRQNVRNKPIFHEGKCIYCKHQLQFTGFSVYLSKTLWSYWMSSLIGGFINFTWFVLHRILKHLYHSMSLCQLSNYHRNHIQISPQIEIVLKPKWALILNSREMPWVLINISCSISHKTFWLSVSNKFPYSFMYIWQLHIRAPVCDMIIYRRPPE